MEELTVRDRFAPLLGTSVVFLISFVPVETLTPALAIGLSVGMLTGYTVYLQVHHAIHFRAPTPGIYLYPARLHHAVHHYRDDEGNFGLLSGYTYRQHRSSQGVLRIFQRLKN